MAPRAPPSRRADAQKAATHYASLVALAEKADQPLRKEVVEARARAH